MTTIVETFANFATETRFEALPAHVVEESKRVLLDSLGCALGGLSHSKGTIGVEYARLQGPGTSGAQASILGTRERVSAIAAGFANAELINALDFDALLPPGHVSPYVIPGALAFAEAVGASGKDLLCAVAIAHELSNRMGKGLDYLRDIKDGKLSSPPVHGYSSTIFGATAAIVQREAVGCDRHRGQHVAGECAVVLVAAHTDRNGEVRGRRRAGANRDDRSVAGGTRAHRRSTAARRP